MLKKVLVAFCIVFSVQLFAQHIPSEPDTTNASATENDVRVFAPNAFTPDGDAFNDTWKVYIQGIDLYDFHLTVFNRNGEIVWESYNAIGEWDGTYGGIDPAPSGIYPWVIETRDAVTDEKYRFTGFIYLML